MKLKELKKIINEQVLIVLNETIYGENAIVFHRTNVSDLVNKVYTTGFHPGGGDVYGRGFYSTYDLKSQLRASMKSYYGNVIVKFSCPTSNFFFFDWNEFEKKELCKTLKCTENDFIKKQLDYFELKYDASKLPESGLSSDIAMHFVNTIENFTKKVDGIVFNGSRDGQVLVSYDLTRIVPLSFSTDEGETWTKVDKNLAYIKRSFNTKQKTPLQRANESFETIEDYAQHLKDTGSLSGTYQIVNGKINVVGDVDLPKEALLNGKIPFAFGKVSGYFFCGDIELTSLENCPEAVNGHFICSDNSLTSLAGAPKTVRGDFFCYNNQLTSLAGAPESVGGDFDCFKNLKKFTENDVTSICKVKGTISV